MAPVNPRKPCISQGVLHHVRHQKGLVRRSACMRGLLGAAFCQADAADRELPLPNKYNRRELFLHQATISAFR